MRFPDFINQIQYVATQLSSDKGAIMRFFWVVGLAGALILTTGSARAQEPDLTSEITRLRKELMQVQEERERVLDEKAKDEEEFRDYRKRMRARMRVIRLETDSIRQVIAQTKLDDDSLGALINATRDRKKQFEMLQERFRRDLIGAAARVSQYAQTLPPGVADKSLSALGLLENELEAKAVDNVEATSRLFQIVADLHENSSVIQIVQGSSPVPEIRGTTYQLRLGNYFQAVVNAKGTLAAVWTGYDEQNAAQWRRIDDPMVAGEILKAVNVREGKSLPSLVSLPLQEVTVSKEGEIEK